MDKSTNYDQLFEEAKNFFLAISERNEANKWELQEDKDGFAVYSRLNPTNGLKMNMTHTVMNFTVDEIIDLIVKVERRGEYDEQFDSGQMVERVDDHTVVNHVKMKSPAFMISPRDIVLGFRIFRNPDNTLVIAKSIVHPQVPPQKGFERAEMILGGWSLTPQPDGKTKVFTLGHLDPKGNIPNAIVNAGGKRQGQMVRNIVKCLEKNKKK